MPLLDREIGQVDRVLGRAADHQSVARDLALADDLAPAGGPVDRADDEAHRCATSSRTR
jgi:hypothetical protein